MKKYLQNWDAILILVIWAILLVKFSIFTETHPMDLPSNVVVATPTATVTPTLTPIPDDSKKSLIPDLQPLRLPE